MTEITKNIDVAIREISKGNVIALPTETVYGLGANGLNKNAVLKIFEIKKRPSFNPLILHIFDITDFEKYARNIPDDLYTLAEIFSPGPLTFVLPKKKIVPDTVTAGLDSVAIRLPAHKLFRQVLKETGVPIAAPSANMFGRISPTTAKDVFKELNGKINYILDGGKCKVGLESTVLSFLNNEIRILRPGIVTQKEIEKVLCKKFTHKLISTGDKPSKKILSPGMLKSHYAPKTPLYIIEDIALVNNLKNKYGLIDFTKYKNLRSIASNLFKEFRNTDEGSFEFAIVQKVEDKGIGIAINDRIDKASTGYIKITNNNLRFTKK
jgi:L-threonylcarbamoyladenylate synthase